MRYLSQCLFGGGSSEGEWRGAVVETVCGRFLSKYQCWVKRGAGVGRIPFFRVGERFRKSISPKGFMFRKDVVLFVISLRETFLREVGARGKRRRAVCRN